MRRWTGYINLYECGWREEETSCHGILGFMRRHSNRLTAKVRYPERDEYRNPATTEKTERRDRHGPLMRRVRLMPLDSPFTYVSQAIYSCICTCRARDVKSLGSREASRRLPSHGAEMRKRVAGPRNKYLRTGTESTSPPAKIPSYTFVFKVHPPLVVRGLIARNPIQFRKD